MNNSLGKQLLPPHTPHCYASHKDFLQHQDKYQTAKATHQSAFQVFKAAIETWTAAKTAFNAAKETFHSQLNLRKGIQEDCDGCQARRLLKEKFPQGHQGQEHEEHLESPIPEEGLEVGGRNR